MAQINELILLSLLITQNLILIQGYVNFEGDSVISEDDSLSVVYEEYVTNLRRFNEEMPRPCRTDICYSENQTEHFLRKGTFVWPEALCGQKVDVRCPFSFDKPVFVSRVCSVNEGGFSQWNNVTDLAIVCPDPPLAELLEKFQDEINQTMTQTHTNITVYEIMLLNVVQVLTHYGDTPINGQDVVTLLKHFFDAIEAFDNSIAKEVADNLITIVNKLLNDELREKFIYSLKSNVMYRRRLLNMFSNSLHHINSNSYKITLSNIEVHLAGVEKITYQQWVIHNSTMTNISLALQNNIIHTNNNAPKISVSIFRKASILKKAFNWTEQSIDFKTTPSRTNERVTNSSVNQTQDQDARRRIPYFKILGGYVVFVSSDDNSTVEMGNVNDRMVVKYSQRTCDQNQTNCWVTWGPYKPVCVKSMDYTSNENWSSTGCTTLYNHTSHGGYTSCECHGLGSFAIFQGSLEIFTAAGPPQLVPPISNMTVTMVTGISSFLGFPYRQHLEIAGHVFGAISLACLIATVASYMIFSNTRRGVPTTILLNLCIALIILTTMLFAILFNTRMTFTLCTLSNVVRYYLIFVTLMWNAVEAFNMYVMLIKVFDSSISRFALKAGILAWGVPAVMVGVCLAVSKKAFDGQHVLISEEEGKCEFRCQLRSNTLYFGYLIPMGLILINNLAVFALVLKAILKLGNRNGQSNKKTRMIQLMGAVATLALLGIPWLFSAFGAIDAVKNDNLAMMEGVFQVVFVVFVNLQGVFIFIFHCARNAQVRQSWSSISSKGTSSSKTSSSAQSSSSRGSTKHAFTPSDHFVRKQKGNNCSIKSNFSCE